MLGLNEGMHYYVCQRYVRINLGINGLYKLVSQKMDLPPLSEAVFIFLVRTDSKSSFCIGIPTDSRCIKNGWKKVPLRYPVSMYRKRHAGCPTRYYPPSWRVYH